jgi:hypothetical protein
MVRALHAPLGIKAQGVMLAEMDLSQAGQRGDVALEKEKTMIEAARSIPRCDDGGCDQLHADERRCEGDSNLPTGNDRVHAEQFCAGDAAVRCRRDTWRLPALGYWAGWMSHGRTPQRRRMWQL